MREWEGLPPDTMILGPAFGAPPMRCPDDVWAMLVSAVDIVGDTDPDRAGEVDLFAGCWVLDQPPANDGDLVVRLTCPADPTYPLPRDHATDVEMLLAYQGRWQRVGTWCGIDDRWPRLAAPTAAAVMGLHDDVTEADTYARIQRDGTLHAPGSLGKKVRGDIPRVHSGWTGDEGACAGTGDGCHPGGPFIRTCS